MDRSTKYANMCLNLPEAFLGKIPPMKVGTPICCGGYEIPAEGPEPKLLFSDIEPILQGICLGGGKIMIEAFHTGFFDETKVTSKIEEAMADIENHKIFLRRLAMLRAIKSEDGIAMIDNVGKFKSYTWRLITIDDIYGALGFKGEEPQPHFANDYFNAIRNYLRDRGASFANSPHEAWLRYTVGRLERLEWNENESLWRQY